jgi:hypothetical protein
LKLTFLDLDEQKSLVSGSASTRNTLSMCAPLTTPRTCFFVTVLIFPILQSPEVTFMVSGDFKAPVHPHCYTNGHICASVLGSGWSPVLNVQSLLLTMQSMLASCRKKVRRLSVLCTTSQI